MDKKSIFRAWIQKFQYNLKSEHSWKAHQILKRSQSPSMKKRHISVHENVVYSYLSNHVLRWPPELIFSVASAARWVPLQNTTDFTPSDLLVGSIVTSKIITNYMFIAENPSVKAALFTDIDIYIYIHPFLLWIVLLLSGVDADTLLSKILGIYWDGQDMCKDVKFPRKRL